MSLPDVTELFWRARAGDAALDADLCSKLAGIGQVAGYPKLRPGFWDCESFCVLPGLLIFNAGDSAPDAAWSNLVVDKDRLLITSTESGYVNADLKLKWYRHCKAQPWCPWGKRPTFPTADHHSSNDSVELSLEMENDEAYLAGGPGHSTHLLQDLDQRGGPIQHDKRILGDLVCHSYRVHGSLSRARIAQAVELAHTLVLTGRLWVRDGARRLGLVDDESSTSTAVIVPPPATVESLALASAPERLALFRAGALDGAVGIAAAREATREVLGKGVDPSDGWNNPEDMPDGIVPEAGGRQ
eukprot:5323932-Prymnesium_polylepis.1